MKDGTTRHVRRYRLARLYLLSCGFLLGLAVAYAECRCWLPRLFTAVCARSFTAYARIGPSLGRSLVVPLLMLGTLPTGGYYYLSRFCLLASSFLCGADTLPLLLSPSPILIASLILIVLWMHLLMRVDIEAARGIAHCTKATAKAVEVGRYLLRLCLIWGEAILICFLFYSTASVA